MAHLLWVLTQSTLQQYGHDKAALLAHLNRVHALQHLHTQHLACDNEESKIHQLSVVCLCGGQGLLRLDLST